ncbi:MAG TPA: hypothetical protein VN628_19190, partial [Vicinamibacterales bacterium]|nr:hypothetical protein [Vicinamibacterales bacterium]
MGHALLTALGRSLPVVFFCVGWPIAAAASQVASTGEPARVVALQIDGEIDPVMAEYIDGGIDQANRTGAALILITMDTPGGLDTSMREIIQHILDSRAPV